ncbi:unnamed protein product [Hyaloperonospora brassicae]|uniref:RxLR effector candidate protein n=1 Tax=Hyaloperonospora brassicae TaxID=162125 RepID=A0AAV0TLC4_HYABA|nr:unnamed protein product [Hyaloperonospora brassicae]
MDYIADTLSRSTAVSAFGVLVVLSLAYYVLAADWKFPVRHDWIATLCAEAKGEPVLLQSLGTQDVTLLSTPKAFEDVLKNQFDNFPKGQRKTEYLREFLGEGIFAVDHDKWYCQRKVASNLFTMRSLRDSMTSTIQRHLVVLERIFGRAAEKNDPVDLYRLFNRFTMEAFTEIAFGVKMDVLDCDKEHPFQVVFDRCQRALVLRFVRPSWFWKTQRFLRVGMERQLKQDIDVINSTVFDIVAKTIQHCGKDAQDDKKAGKDIISLFLDNMDQSKDADGGCFDPVYLRDIAVNFIIAGHDTAAQALSWFFYYLSQNKQVEANIHKELDAKLPELCKGKCSPSMDEVSELTYMEAALLETLRLYPSVPFVSKEAVRDTVLSDGAFIAAGSYTGLPMYALGRMPHVWGPDAADFKPERWIDMKTGKLITVSAYQFVAFNAGPRTCLGKNLAMLEMKLIVASLLSKYHVELESPEMVT